MYIKKITKIDNTGKFHKGGISGGEYDKFTLFYAGNGRGKTTLCAILRSLKTGSAIIINDRQTLGETFPPNVQLLLDSGVAQFTGGKWSTVEDDLHIFDDSFVTANVHAGEEVNTDQRRSLYRVIVGSKGVKLAEEVDNLDKKITKTTAQITNEKKVINQHVPTNLTFDKFISLINDPDIDEKITAQDSKIKAATQATEIARKPLLTPCVIPGLPTDFLALIEKTVVGVSTDAAKKLELQLEKHKFGDDGEGWLATGLQHLDDDSCPFCAASVKDNPLIGVYKQFFDIAYEQFKGELTNLQSQTIKELSEASALKAKAALGELGNAIKFWRAFGNIEVTLPPSLETLAEKLSKVSMAAQKILEIKIASPLEKISTAELETANADWQIVVDEIISCNAALATANTAIKAIKVSTAKVDKAALEKTLVELQAVKKRHSTTVEILCDNYNGLVAEKVTLVAEKESKKLALDNYDASVLPTYHNKINDYLAIFGAGFKLQKSEKNYVGKMPQWIYTIEINNHAIDITKKPGFGEASFQTTMSAGDRNTLALAFFFGTSRT